MIFLFYREAHSRKDPSGNYERRSEPVGHAPLLFHSLRPFPLLACNSPLHLAHLLPPIRDLLKLL
jgi:hypothetical protein